MAIHGAVSMEDDDADGGMLMMMNDEEDSDEDSKPVGPAQGPVALVAGRDIKPNVNPVDMSPKEASKCECL
jgi:hypothetical protein